ncbi:MAG: hypothetical protein LBI85_08125, partial [Spirochaetaceae bacterium]|nr:hypothetical protein [Spirochaetaceae bacterium]
MTILASIKRKFDVFSECQFMSNFKTGSFINVKTPGKGVTPGQSKGEWIRGPLSSLLEQQRGLKVTG